MKNLVICFDGTWNTADMKRRTFSFSQISWWRSRREPREDGLAEVFDIARLRIREPGAKLYERRNYRPKTLHAVIRKHAAELGLA